MTTLCLIVMLAVQEPAVAYREGLYEEVDQGNLDKAMAHYAKVLKGEAEPALKARALFRSGFCLEKLGRKKDAEQTYRNLLAQFPGQEESVRLTQARLDALGGKEPAAAPTLESQLSRLILELGGSHEERPRAIRQLTLIGATAIPELKRASQHRDLRLSMGAAEVLVALEQYDGLYEVFLRPLQSEADGWSNHVNLPMFIKLLDARSEDKQRFIKVAAKLPPAVLLAVAVHNFSLMRDASHAAQLEDRIVAEEDAALLNAWSCGVDPARLAPLLQRLGGERPQIVKIATLLDVGLQNDVSETVRASTSRLLLGTLKGANVAGKAGPKDELGYAGLARRARSYMTTEDFCDLLGGWLKLPSPEASDVCLMACELHARGGKDLREFLFDVIASDSYSLAVRALAASRLAKPGDIEEHVQKLVRFHVSSLKSVLTAKTRDEHALYQSALFLLQTLPPDSPDLDSVFELGVTTDLIVGHAPPRHAARYADAAVKALARTECRATAISVLATYGSTRQRLAVGTVLKEMEPDGVALQLFTDAVYAAPPEERAKSLEAIKPLLKTANPVRRALFQKLCGYSELNDLMKAAIHDSDTEVKTAALRHWRTSRDPQALPLLTEALKDSDERIVEMAAEALGEAPSMASVPPLIDLLQSPSTAIRTAVRDALTKIRKHFDEQDEWREWYRKLKERK